MACRRVRLQDLQPQPDFSDDESDDSNGIRLENPGPSDYINEDGFYYTCNNRLYEILHPDELINRPVEVQQHYEKLRVSPTDVRRFFLNDRFRAQFLSGHLDRVAIDSWSVSKSIISDECLICGDMKPKGSRMLRLSCSHEFFYCCIFRWFENGGTCLMCPWDSTKLHTDPLTIQGVCN
ncbi:hypothetical protein AB5N19_11813 [Seiridium cardinale]